MADVMIRCPRTNEPIPTGIGMDRDSFDSTTLENNTISRCPECGGSHTWSKKDAFILGDD